MSKTKTSNSLKWRFDVNAFRLLGRELITDRITALVELVKNSYDANATKVFIEFNNVGSLNQSSEIIIKDNGIGMSFDDVRDKWMVVGTKSKRVSQYSPKPFKRKYIGEKGIGRFAVDKLGGCLTMVTKTKNAKEELEVKIDWEEDYGKPSQTNTELTLFTEIENNFTISSSVDTTSGTTLQISKIHEIWTKRDIQRAKTELSKIISPFHRLKKPFEIFISSNEYAKEFDGKKPLTISKSSYDAEEFILSFSNGKQKQLFFDKKTGKIIPELIDKPKFGFVKMRIFYFDTEAKKRFNKNHKPSGRNIDGFKVYRDGVLATPFAEQEDNSFKQRDIFGIDKQLWQNTFDKIGNREIIGLIDITKEGNPQIRDATNRQDFITNEEYTAFKDFIFHQLGEISKYKISNRSKRKKDINKNFITHNNELIKVISDFKKFSSNVKKNNPLLAPQMEVIEIKLKETSGVVKNLAKVNKEIDQESKRKENLYLSLMSLQEYAANLSHAVRTSLGKIKRMAEFFKAKFPNPKYEQQFILYSNRVFEEITTLEKVVDFMLGYAKSGLEVEEFNVREVIENLFHRFYQHIFDFENIRNQVEITHDFVLNGNRKFIEDIFENLVANSIKGLEGTTDKVIKVSGGIEDENFVCYFSDNGKGIIEEDKEKIFEIYYTTTAHKGGAGLGLFIVRKRLEALHGNIKVIEKEFNTGVTFKITLPFKKTT